MEYQYSKVLIIILRQMGTDIYTQRQLKVTSIEIEIFWKIYNTAFLATVTFMFLVKEKLVWRDKTVT